MPIVRFTVRDLANPERVWEDRDCYDARDDPEDHVRGLIDKFNLGQDMRNLPHRELVEVLSSGEKDRHPQHRWEKTNAITISRGGRMFDTYRCEVCGVTGKRYGVGGVKRDHRFRGERWAVCQEERVIVDWPPRFLLPHPPGYNG